MSHISDIRNAMKLRAMDKKFLVGELSLEDIDVKRSDGNYLTDSKGKKYIDFFVGWCVGNLGWGNTEIKKVIHNFKGPEYVFPDYVYKPWVELAQLLVKITPASLQKCFRATGGTEAIEIALQAAMSHTKRHKFVSIEGSYHGHSMAAMSIGSSDFRQLYKNLLPHCYKIKPPLGSKALAQLEKILKKGDIAAFIMEPIILNLGVEIPTQEFMTGAQALCKKYGTLLIIDEVATGFGRTGKMFASEHYGIEPDIMCLGKAITGGYGSMGATLVSNEVAKSMSYEFSFYSTYGWHPLSTNIAIANIKYHLKYKKQIEKNVAEIGTYIVERLSRMQFAHTPTIRAQGLAIGVTFAEAGYAHEIAKHAKNKGLLICPEPDNKTFTIFPALTLDHTTAQRGMDILESILNW